MHKGPYHPRMVPIENHQCIKHPLYMTWANMFSRCENHRDPSYRNYGARGITVCRRWYEFKLFLVDMGPRPSKRHSIDRIDNDKGYMPSNCRWATRSEQMLNRRTFTNNTSGLRGVVRHGANGWQARIDVNKIRYVIGYYEHHSEAVAARSKFDKLFAKDPKQAIASIKTGGARWNSQTKQRGINPHADGGFIVRITANQQRIYVGYFKNLEDAIRERDRAIKAANR